MRLTILPFPAASRIMLAGLALAFSQPSPAQAGMDNGGEVIRLWPGAAPETPSDWIEPEYHGKESITFVTTPTLTIVRPDAEKASGAAMIVAPGGAFTGLAWRLEGLEIARWLADRGITAFVLKYRVRPGKEARQPRTGGAPTTIDPDRFNPGIDLAAADAMQAVRIVRQDASRLRIDPRRIGFIGFSAGAMTAMNVVMKGDASSRPDFVAPIYGAMPDLPVPADAPPAFVLVASDDPIMFEGSMNIFRRWIAASRPADLHVYARGGHGFGMRPRGLPVDGWPAVFEGWLAAQGALAKAPPAP